jgi:hypothetical protein
MTQDNNSNTHDREYKEPNDRSTFMTDLEKVVKELEEKGYTDEYKIEKKQLVSLSNNKKYKPKDVKAVNFFRFEGTSNPDDMSILYAIETCDGRKGILIDAYGTYADDDISEFVKTVEINKKTN